MTNPFDFTSYADFIMVGSLVLFVIGGFFAMLILGSPDPRTGTSWMDDHPRAGKVFGILVVLPTCVGLLAVSGFVILGRIARVLT